MAKARFKSWDDAKVKENAELLSLFRKSTADDITEKQEEKATKALESFMLDHNISITRAEKIFSLEVYGV